MGFRSLLTLQRCYKAQSPSHRGAPSTRIPAMGLLLSLVSFNPLRIRGAPFITKPQGHVRPPGRRFQSPSHRGAPFNKAASNGPSTASWLTRFNPLRIGARPSTQSLPPLRWRGRFRFNPLRIGRALQLNSLKADFAKLAQPGFQSPSHRGAPFNLRSQKADIEKSLSPCAVGRALQHVRQVG